MDTKNKISSTAGTVLLALIICLSVAGCGKTFYRSLVVYKAKQGVSQDKKAYKVLKPAVLEARYIIIHQDTSVWLLKNAGLDNGSNSITGTFEKPDAEYEKYHAFEKKAQHRGSSYYREESEEKYASSQMHIYLNKDLAFPYRKGSAEVIPFSGISMIKDFRPDNGRNAAKIVIPVVAGVGATMALLVGAVVAVCNCPYVYASNGSGFDFSGTMFTGALYKNLERDDYMALSGLDLAAGAQLKIMNVKKEQQFTNMAELIVAEHPAGLHVLADKNGALHTYRLPVPAVSAISAERFDHTDALAEKDKRCFSFNDDQDKEPLNDVVISFVKPKGAGEGKLILNARNTGWSGYTYDQICKLLGEKYGDWTKKQSGKSKEELIAGALKQGGPLAVYIFKNGGWRYVDYINIVGAMMDRDVILPLDLSGINSDTVSIKLKCAFMFWELDYAGMDFTKDEQLKITVLKPASALDSLGVDHKTELMMNDTLYLQHYNTKDYVMIRFDAMQAQKDLVQTVFLHSKGYYSRMDTYEGKPDYKELLKVRRPGGFSVYSKEKYYELLNSMNAKNILKNGN
jgi:hypothetical protein